MRIEFLPTDYRGKCRRPLIAVWIMKGEVYGKRELSPLVGLQNSKSGKGGGGRKDNRGPRRRK